MPLIKVNGNQAASYLAFNVNSAVSSRFGHLKGVTRFGCCKMYAVFSLLKQRLPARLTNEFATSLVGLKGQLLGEEPEFDVLLVPNKPGLANSLSREQELTHDLQAQARAASRSRDKNMSIK